MIRLVALFLALLMALPASAPASAHEVRPAYLQLREVTAGTWDVTWKQPVMGDSAVQLVPLLSNGWLQQRPEVEELTDTYYIRHWRIHAPASQLAGSRVSVDGLESTITDVLIHADSADGRHFDTILRRDRTSAAIDFGRQGSLAVPAYLGLGVRHILTGADHLAFVLGLLLLVGGGLRLVWAISAFTLAHSITLAASALGYVEAPVAAIEALVALSIVFVARELVKDGKTGLTARYPWLIAFTFGLLHGFAFAGALAETGLPKDAIPMALLLFNIGVEIGQLLFVAAAMLAILALRHLLRSMPDRPNALAGKLVPYALGSFAAFLFIGRTVAAFA